MHSFHTFSAPSFASFTRLGRAGLFLLLLTVIARSSLAQLSWETRQLDFHPKAEDASVRGEFAFTNVGNTPITITDVKTSCGCTTTVLEKKTYASGEKGAISTTFTIGDRVGFQQKQIVVRTDHPEEMFIQLTVRAFIPEWLKSDPRIVHWAINGPTEARVVKLSTGTDQPIKVIGVQTSDDRIFAKLKPIQAGKVYEVTITPSSTAEPLRAFLRIETDYPAQKPKVYNIPVNIGAPTTRPAASPTAIPPLTRAPRFGPESMTLPVKTK